MRKLVTMNDAYGIPRAYGIAPTVELARAEALRQLDAYIAKKRKLGDPSDCLDPKGYKEKVEDCFPLSIDNPTKKDAAPAPLTDQLKGNAQAKANEASWPKIRKIKPRKIK